MDGKGTLLEVAILEKMANLAKIVRMANNRQSLNKNSNQMFVNI